jgi:hypothetical protein
MLSFCSKVIYPQTGNGPNMAKSKKGNDAAKKAWETMRRRGNPPKFDTSTTQGAVLKHAYKAAVAAIGRAKKNGLPVDEEWMLASHLLIEEQGYCCKATGISFDVDFKTGGAGGTHLAPSPDQVTPGCGYVPGNVRWVLWAVNRAKGEMPEDLFVNICRGLVNRHDVKN